MPGGVHHLVGLGGQFGGGADLLDEAVAGEQASAGDLPPGRVHGDQGVGVADEQGGHEGRVGRERAGLPVGGRVTPGWHSLPHGDGGSQGGDGTRPKVAVGGQLLWALRPAPPLNGEEVGAVTRGRPRGVSPPPGRWGVGWGWRARAAAGRRRLAGAAGSRCHASDCPARPGGSEGEVPVRSRLLALSLFGLLVGVLAPAASGSPPGGSIVAWGRNVEGQASPPAGEDFVAVSAGDRFSLALRADGSIAAWGDDSAHQASPPAGNDFVAIAAGGAHGLALRADGSLVGWGRQLGWPGVASGGERLRGDRRRRGAQPGVAGRRVARRLGR